MKFEILGYDKVSTYPSHTPFAKSALPVKVEMFQVPTRQPNFLSKFPHKHAQDAR
jgi:hypothetical protein